MSETIYQDVFDAEIVLTDSVKTTIFQNHPEVGDFFDRVAGILSDPDEIRRSVRNVHVLLYYQYDAAILKGKWLVVVVKQVDRNFVSTIYATDQIKSGEQVWKKSI